MERSGQGVDKMFYNCIMEGKALPDYSGTDPYQVSLTFKAPIQDAAFVIFIRNEQNKRTVAEQLNVFELLTLYKVAMRDYEGLEKHILQKLTEEGLVIDENGSYRLSDDYRNDAVEKLKGLNMNHLKWYPTASVNTVLSAVLCSKRYLQIYYPKTDQDTYLKNGRCRDYTERRCRKIYTLYKNS